MNGGVRAKKKLRYYKKTIKDVLCLLCSICFQNYIPNYNKYIHKFKNIACERYLFIEIHNTFFAFLFCVGYHLEMLISECIACVKGSHIIQMHFNGLISWWHTLYCLFIVSILEGVSVQDENINGSFALFLWVHCDCHSLTSYLNCHY